jgi:hypothetical protein
MGNNIALNDKSSGGIYLFMHLVPRDPSEDTIREINDATIPDVPEDSAVEDIDSRDEIPGDKDSEEKETIDPQDDRSDRDPAIDSPAAQGEPYS